MDEEEPSQALAPTEAEDRQVALIHAHVPPFLKVFGVGFVVVALPQLWIGRHLLAALAGGVVSLVAGGLFLWVLKNWDEEAARALFRQGVRIPE